MLNSLFQPELIQTLVQDTFKHCTTEKSSSFEILWSWKNLVCVNLNLLNAKVIQEIRSNWFVRDSKFGDSRVNNAKIHCVEILRIHSLWHSSFIPFQVPHFGPFSKFIQDSSVTHHHPIFFHKFDFKFQALHQEFSRHGVIQWENWLVCFAFYRKCCE